MILMIMKQGVFVMYNKEPATNAHALMNKIKFFLEKTWINFFPRSAPKRAPNGIHPVRMPLAVSVGMSTPNT